MSIVILGMLCLICSHSFCIAALNRLASFWFCVFTANTGRDVLGDPMELAIVEELTPLPSSSRLLSAVAPGAAE